MPDNVLLLEELERDPFDALKRLHGLDEAGALESAAVPYRDL